MGDYQILPFQSSNEIELLGFVRRNPWKPAWPESLIHRFFRDLVSTPNFIFDLHLKTERVAIAVLLDKVSNKGNNATVEILAISPHAEMEAVHSRILELSRYFLPKNRDGFEISLSESLPFIENLICEYGMTLYYETFEMLTLAPPSPFEIQGDDFSLANPDDDKELYEVLKAAFQDNVDTSIPDYEIWRQSRYKSLDQKTWLARKKVGDLSKIIGFLNLVVQEAGAEIRTVGVLPEYRGQGLGRKLISLALNDLAGLGIDDCKLTVAIQNQKALQLYQDLGFKPIEHYLIYRWERSSPA
jgi:ribosomal protein S18 acetylase RimI-like enzyme